MNIFALFGLESSEADEGMEGAVYTKDKIEKRERERKKIKVEKQERTTSELRKNKTF